MMSSLLNKEPLELYRLLSLSAHYFRLSKMKPNQN